MKKYTVLAVSFFAVVIVATTATGTTQVSDKILFEGEKYELAQFHLEPFLRKNPDKRPVGGVVSSALRRGYVATFRVLSGSLFVENVEVEVRTRGKSAHSFDYTYKSVTPQVFSSGVPVKAEWVTGILNLKYKIQASGIRSHSWQDHILIEVKNGNISQVKKLSDDEFEHFKKKQIEAFKKTDAYRQLVTKSNNPEILDRLLSNKIFEYSAKFYVDEKPKPRSSSKHRGTNKDGKGGN